MLIFNDNLIKNTMFKNILCALGMSLLLLSSCDSYLESETYNSIDSQDAFKTVDDIKAARNGLYRNLGQDEFCGTNILALGDFASDIAVADGSSGHYVSINTYSVGDYDSEFQDTWEYGYIVINTSTQALLAIDNLLTDASLTDAVKNELNLYKAEIHGLRALAYFHLVNVFGLPYGTDSNPHGGLVLMSDKAILPMENVSRSSVEETYEQILTDISSSLKAYELTSTKTNGFYFNEAAVNALKARVLLFMGNDQLAIDAATQSLTLRGVKEMNEEGYLGMWKSLTLSDEEIFSIAKSEDDNLSANSLNTLYGSYGGKLTSSLVADFNENDYRLKLINMDDFHPKKFDGIESSASTSNIPQFRVSEMKLIIAEASARLDLLDDAREALLFTAKRNYEIVSVTDLPTTKDALLAFIAKERKREFFQEGHRFYDARRTGELITVSNGKYENFDVQKFVYPIPADEINSGYKCEQNENWFDNLPQ